MEKHVKVKRCIHSCPFYGSSMDGMECNHPYFDDKGGYQRMMIITHEEGTEGYPTKCPLRGEVLTVKYYIG